MAAMLATAKRGGADNACPIELVLSGASDYRGAAPHNMDYPPKR